MVYIILTRPLFGPAKVSQEGYKTLQAAQKFCLSRPGAVKHSEYLFYAGDYNYEIVDVSIK